MAAILVVGWTTAGALYVTTPAVVEDAEIYEMEHSKKVLRDLERIGGKSAVFTSDLNAWVASRWEGKTRASTVAWLTLFVAAGYVLLERAWRAGAADE